MKVLIKILIRIEMDLIKFFVKWYRSIMIFKMIKVRVRLERFLKFVFFLLLVMLFMVIGISVILIIVIIEFVMIGGKNDMSFLKKNEIRMIRIFEVIMFL